MLEVPVSEPPSTPPPASEDALLSIPASSLGLGPPDAEPSSPVPVGCPEVPPDVPPSPIAAPPWPPEAPVPDDPLAPPLDPAPPGGGAPKPPASALHPSVLHTAGKRQ